MWLRPPPPRCLPGASPGSLRPGAAGLGPGAHSTAQPGATAAPPHLSSAAPRGVPAGRQPGTPGREHVCVCVWGGGQLASTRPVSAGHPVAWPVDGVGPLGSTLRFRPRRPEPHGLLLGWTLDEAEPLLGKAGRGLSSALGPGRVCLCLDPGVPSFLRTTERTCGDAPGSWVAFVGIAVSNLPAGPEWRRGSLSRSMIDDR